MLRSLTASLYATLGNWYLAPVLLRDWRRSGTLGINERAMEYEFALRWLWRTCPAAVLDVGSGKSSWPHLMAACGFQVTASDQKRARWGGEFFNRHYHVVSDDITQSRLAGSYDLVTCISVLEHIPDYRSAVNGMLSLLSPGGHLVMSFPYNESTYVRNAYELPEAGYGKERSYVCQVFSRNELREVTENGHGRIVDQEYYEVFSGELWTCGHRLRPPRRVGETDRHHLTCVAMQKA